MGRPKLRLGMVLVAAAVVAAACSSKSTTTPSLTGPTGTTGASPSAPPATSTPAELTTIRFRLSFIPGSDHTMYAVCIEEGFCNQAGIDLQLQPASDPTSAVKIVASGRDQMGYTYAPDLLFAIDNDLPVTAVYAIMQKADFGLICKASSNIHSPKDLRGKPVGVTDIPSDQVSLDTLLASAGLDRDTVQVVDVGFNGEHQLLADRVVCTSGLTWSEGVHLDAQGIPSTFLFYRDYGVPDYPFEVVIANRDFLQSNGDIVKSFLGALTTSMQFAIDNPDQAVRDLVAENPDLTFEDMRAEWDAVSQQLTSPQTEAHGLGYQDPATYAAVTKFFVDHDLIKQAPDQSLLFTNDYLPGTG